MPSSGLQAYTETEHCIIINKYLKKFLKKKKQSRMDHGDIPAPSRLRQEDCHTKKAIHGYIAQPCLMKTKRKKKKRKAKTK